MLELIPALRINIGHGAEYFTTSSTRIRYNCSNCAHFVDLHTEDIIIILACRSRALKQVIGNRKHPLIDKLLQCDERDDTVCIRQHATCWQ